MFEQFGKPGGHKHWKLFCGGSKTIGVNDRFQKNGKSDCGILINHWNPEIVKTLANPIDSNQKNWKYLDTCWIIYGGLWNLCILGRSKFRIFEILKHNGNPKNTDSHPCTLAAAPWKGPGARTRFGVWWFGLQRFTFLRPQNWSNREA